MPGIVRLGRPGRLQWSLAVLKFTSGWMAENREDVLRSVNGTASKCKTFLATATEECCPAIGTLAGRLYAKAQSEPYAREENTTAAGLPATQKKQSAPAILSGTIQHSIRIDFRRMRFCK